MTAGSPVFVDTNVLVYFTFAHFAQHQAARQRLAECERLPVPLWTSRQVLREFLAVTTRPGFLMPLPPPPFLVKTLQDFEGQFQIAADDAEVTAGLLELIENPGAQGKQVHDANIVATMRRHQIVHLVTHNAEDFRRYELWITVVPLIPWNGWGRRRGRRGYEGDSLRFFTSELTTPQTGRSVLHVLT